jgi:DnaJ-domain-containing protein 1/uncharacterized membrane protein YciS (DUF1049 family)
MNIGEYYVTTLTAAAMKIGPILLFAVCGYFIFVKLPFLFLKNSMTEQKKKLEDEGAKSPVLKKDYSVEDYNKFVRQMKQINEKSTEKESPHLKIAANQSQSKQEKKAENKKQESKQKSKKEETKTAARSSTDSSAESVFNFKSGEKFTKEELKKRYHDLLRQNHPDRVASMGADFKKLAEQNTKDINKAYEKLKVKAS